MFTDTTVSAVAEFPSVDSNIAAGIAASIAAACVVFALNWAGVPLAAASEFQMPPIVTLAQ